MATQEVFDETRVDTLPAPELAQQLGGKALNGVVTVEIVSMFDVPRRPTDKQLEDVAWYYAVA